MGLVFLPGQTASAISSFMSTYASNGGVCAPNITAILVGAGTAMVCVAPLASSLPREGGMTPPWICMLSHAMMCLPTMPTATTTAIPMTIIAAVTGSARHVCCTASSGTAVPSSPSLYCTTEPQSPSVPPSPSPSLHPSRATT